MDVFLGDWLNLLLRWAHLLVGIGWIGTSFYFVALDLSLDREERKSPGVHGTAWQVHGGGFYHVEKFTVAPPSLPPRLHWFKWEAYLTWATGFGLIVVQYYVHARTYLIDPAVLPLAPWQAILLSMGSLAAGWFIYDGLCRSPLGRRQGPLAVAVLLLIFGAAVYFSLIFSGRGALLHIGAFTGTIMAVNVFGVIIPNQKKMVAQMLRGEAPLARYGQVGKQRSLHNNYLTLPVLLMMVSGHYPFLSSHPHAWMVVALVFLVGGLFRHVLNCIDAGQGFGRYGWAAALALVALLAAIYLTAPRELKTVGTVGDAEIVSLTRAHCIMCHSARPTHEAFTEAPKNVMLDTLDQIRQFAPMIYQQAVVNNAMPLGNQTGITEDERARLGAWIRSQP